MFDQKAETISRDELNALQLKRLKDTVARVAQSVPTYLKKFSEAGIGPGDISSLDDLRRLPFTVKDDLREAYPFGMFAVPMRDIVRIHASSGTTGQVTVVGYTRNDIAMWAEMMARTLACAGASADDIVHNAYGYGLFTGGLGIHYGTERLGAAVVPISGGNTKRQIKILQDFKATILTCTPSYALHLAEAAEEMGVDFKELDLKAGCFGAEPWSESMRSDIEDKLNLDAIDIYGLSEVLGPGVASECLVKNGLHVNEDNFLIEIIDPQTMEPVETGKEGEVVFTTITKEGIPVIRYRTRDISTIIPGECSCGRTFQRMRRVSGRSDDMLIIRGVNVFPSQIEQILMEIEGTEPHYQIVVDRSKELDEVEVQVEVSDKVFSDEVRGLENLARKVASEIDGQLGVRVAVKLVEPKTIQRSEGKAKRVIDKREL